MSKEISSETWVLKEMAEVADKLKLTLMRTGEVYGQLFMYVPLDGVASYRIGDRFDISITAKEPVSQ